MNNDEDLSSETSDDDYVPEEESDDEVVSDCDNRSDYNDAECVDKATKSSQKSLKRKNKNGVSTTRKRRGGIKLVEDIHNANPVHKEEEGNIVGDPGSSYGEDQSQDDAHVDEESNKSRADALWSSFKKDVDMKSKVKQTNKEAEFSSKSPNILSNGNTKSSNPTTITKVYSFVGEEVRVTEQLDSASQEVKEESMQPDSSSSPFTKIAKKPAGLGNILSKIGGKKRISTLEKSRLDWNQFKQNEGIEEELHTFNKGKDGYLEKQAFLERTDLRQYEIERNVRMSNHNKR